MMRSLPLLAVALTACQTGASRTDRADADLDAVRGALAHSMPSTAVKTIRPAPVAGLYEVTAGRNVFYVDQTARHLFVGAIYDMASREDLTAKRLAAARRVNFSDLPLDAAIAIRQGTGARRIALFSDPDCPYCRRLEAELAKLPDVTIHVFMTPLAQHELARAKVRNIWCARAPAEAWRALMTDGREPEAAGNDCEAPLARIATLARELNIKAAPTLLSDDGRIHTGVLASPQLEQWLNGGSS